MLKDNKMNCFDSKEIRNFYQNASNDEDIKNLMDRLDKNLTIIDHKIEQISHDFEKEQKDFQDNYNKFISNEIKSNFQQKNHQKKLQDKVFSLGDLVVEKVQNIEQEIENVNEILKFVESIDFLKKKMKQIENLMDCNDYKKSAELINQIYKNVPEKNIKSKFAFDVISSLKKYIEPHLLLKEWIEKLTEVFKTEFFNSLKEKKSSQLTEFFVLFPLIGKDDVGINVYYDFVCIVIAETLNALIEFIKLNKNEEMKVTNFGSIIWQIYETVFSMFQSHLPIIKKYYENNYDKNILIILKNVQYEIDSQICTITDIYYENKKLDLLLHEINELDFINKLESLKKENVDQFEKIINDNILSSKFTIKELSNSLSETATIVSHWSFFKISIVKIFINSTDHDRKSDDLILKITELLDESKISQKVNDFFSVCFEYVCLYHLATSIQKSFSSEQILPLLKTFISEKNEKQKNVNNMFYFSCIDDITFVFKKTLKLIIETGVKPLISKIVKKLFNLFDLYLINHLFAKKLNSNQPSYNQSLNLNKNSDLNYLPSNTHEMKKLETESNSYTDTLKLFKGASSTLNLMINNSNNSKVPNSYFNSRVSNNSSNLLNYIAYLNTILVGKKNFDEIYNYLISNESLGYSSSIRFNTKEINELLNLNFFTPLSKSFTKILSENLIIIYNQCIKNKLIVLIKNFFPDDVSNYIISSDSEINDTSHMYDFNLNWDLLIKHYSEVFDHSNYNRLLRLIIVNLTIIIENRLLVMLKKYKINELGLVFLSKNISFLINKLCLDDYQLKKKFERVNQIIFLISMNNDEYTEYIKIFDDKKTNTNTDSNDLNYNLYCNLTSKEIAEIRRLRL